MMKQVGLILVSAVVLLALYAQKEAMGGAYTNSSHGNTSYGVKRTSSVLSGYAQGNCAHCHEQHASIAATNATDGEPTPVGGAPSTGLVFYNNYVSQTDGFCFMCHTSSGSYQNGGLVNRSYSYRAGGYISDTLSSVKAAFGLASAHNLANISTFINTQSWGYTSASNSCAACHNPHAAQGDPANAGSSLKTNTSRGWLVARPSQHGNLKTWGLWGDGSTEIMSYYASLLGYTYLAPYRVYTATPGDNGSEPEGNATTNGSNLTDFVSLCTDCHNASNSITSTPLGRTLRTIDWSTGANGNKHGNLTADGSLNGDAPYGTTMGRVLSCLDCHEPHGSANAFLIRPEVNGAALGVTIPSFGGTAYWNNLCNRCHQDDSEFTGACQQNFWFKVHHDNCAVPEAPYPAFSSCSPDVWSYGTTCNTGGLCHSDTPPTTVGTPPCTTTFSTSPTQIVCTQCHFHGSVTNGTTIPTPVAPTPRRTF